MDLELSIDGDGSPHFSDFTTMPLTFPAGSTDNVCFELSPSAEAVAGTYTFQLAGETVQLGTGCLPESLPVDGVDYCYAWEPIDGLDDPASARPNATPSETTTYMVYVATSEGELIVEEVLVEVISSNLQLSPIPAILCPNDLITIYPDEGQAYYDYSWSNGENLESIVVNSTGTYSVTATSIMTSSVSGEGCQASGQATVLDEFSEDDLLMWFESSGFKKFEIQVLGPIGAPQRSFNPQNNSITLFDYAQLLIELNGTEVDLAQYLNDYITILNTQNQVCSNTNSDLSAIISSGICSMPSISEINTQFSNIESDIKYWFHILETDSQSYLFVKAYSSYSLSFTEDQSIELTSDYPTWGALKYILGGQIPKVNYSENDYFSTDGNYLGSGLAGGEIKIVDVSSVNLNEMSSQEKLNYFEAKFHEHHFYNATEAYKKILMFYESQYVCSTSGSPYLRIEGSVNPAARIYPKYTNRVCRPKPVENDPENLFYARYFAQFCRKGLVFGLGEDATPFTQGAPVDPTTQLNHKANLVNIIVHESHHYVYDMIYVDFEGDLFIYEYEVGNDGNDLNKRRHLEGAYYNQVNDPSWEHTTVGFKEGIEITMWDLFINSIQDQQIKNEMIDLFDGYFD